MIVKNRESTRYLTSQLHQAYFFCTRKFKFKQIKFKEKPKGVTSVKPRNQFIDKLHPSLFKLKNQIESIESRLQRSISLKNADKANIQRTPTHLLQSFLYGNILPRFQAKARFPEYYRRDHNVLARSNYQSHLQPQLNQANKNIVFGRQKQQQQSFILGIETSFDDCCMALVSSKGKVLRSVSRNLLSMRYKVGGVDPLMASQLHKQSLPELYDQIQNELQRIKLQSIAVTVGPGQEYSLNQGIKFAQDLGKSLNKQVIPINHAQAHCLISRSPQLHPQRQDLLPGIQFPYISCLMTGTINDLILHKDVGSSMILGTSLDLSIGASLDRLSRQIMQHPVMKNQKMINQFIQSKGKDPNLIKFFQQIKSISNRQSKEPSSNQKVYHGGRYLQYLASLGNHREQAKIPNSFNSQLDLSFSGTTTSHINQLFQKPTHAISKHKRQYRDLSIQQLCDQAATIEFKMFGQIQQKVWKMLDWVNLRADLNKDLKTVCLVGGVARNKKLRSLLESACKAHEKELFVPPPELCSDNAVMIAWNAWEMKNKQIDIDIKVKIQCCVLKFYIQDRAIKGINKFPVGPVIKEAIVRKGFLNAKQWTN